MTVLDDRAEALADQLRSASLAAAQLADARDQAQAEPGAVANPAATLFAARDFNADEAAAEQRRPGTATDTRTSQE